MVVSGAELQVHQVKRSQRRSDEDEFHESVVNADEGGEQIQIAGEISDGEEDL